MSVCMQTGQRDKRDNRRSRQQDDRTTTHRKNKTAKHGPKGVKDEVKQAQRAANLMSGLGGAPGLLVDYNICVTLVSTYIDDIVCRVEVIQIDKDTEIDDR